MHDLEGDSAVQLPSMLGGRYELGGLIGRGATADVFAGRDLRLDRPVAIKILRSGPGRDPAVRGRFESEARLAARLAHPHVVAVFDSGAQGARPYVVMEQLSGVTLCDRLMSGPLAAGELRDLATQVLAALEAAHGLGIVHRDIKPGNILAGPNGNWKLGDFGIAKAMDLGTSEHTGTGWVIGTPAYLAPERLCGAQATVRSDLYALGIVLYEAATGRKPFEADGPEDWARVVAGGIPDPLGGIRPDVEWPLADAIERCLAKDPHQRFVSASEMLTAITRRPGRAGAPETVAMAAAPATELLPAPERHRFSAPIRTRIPPRLLAWICGTVVLLAAIATTIALTTGGAGRARSTSVPSSTVPAPASAILPAGLSNALSNLERQVQR